MNFKNYLLFFSFLFLAHISFSQLTNSFEWIPKNKKALKITINKNGVYRIKFKELFENGLDIKIDSIDYLKLYNLGQEYPFNIIKTEEEFFSDKNFLEFYAEKYKGNLDSLYYQKGVTKPYASHSLYTNENVFFLFYSNQKTEVYKPCKSEISNDLIPEKYYIKSDTKYFTNNWTHDPNFSAINNNKQYNSLFANNEGLCSERYGIGVFNNPTFRDTLKFENIYNGENSYFSTEIKLFAQNLNSTRTIVQKLMNDSSFVEFSGLNSAIIKFKNTPNNSRIPLELFVGKTNSIDIFQRKAYEPFHLFYLKTEYSSKFHFSENKYFKIPQSTKKDALIRIPNATKSEYLIYNISKENSPEKLCYSIIDSTLNILINESNKNSNLLFIDIDWNTPLSIEKINFINNINQNDIIFITNNKLLESVKDYKLYRESPKGGNYKSIIFTFDDICNTFSYGIFAPIAFNNFSKYLELNSIPSKHILLIGKGYGRPNVLNSKSTDYIPTFGYPGSDQLLFSPNISISKISISSIGRLSFQNNEEVKNYLEKIKAYEQERKNIFWRKNILHLSGGVDNNQIIEFRNYLKRLSSTNKNNRFGTEFKLIAKSSLDPVQNIDISNQLNEGHSLVTFLGHGNANLIDLNIGQASVNSNLKNKPTYPFFFFNGCNISNIFVNDKNTFSEDWLLSSDKGAIGVLAHTSYSYVNTNMTYMEEFYKNLLNPLSLNLSIGEVIQITNENLLPKAKNDAFLMANIRQLLLQGDPAIRIFNFDKPDFKVNDDAIFLTGTTKDKTVAAGEDFNLNIVASNYGIYEKGTNFNLKLKKTYSDGKAVEEIKTVPAIAYQDTITYKIKKETNLKYITVELDADGKIVEMDETNNLGVITLDWAALANTNYFSTAAIEDRLNPTLTVKLAGQRAQDNINVGGSDVLDISLIDDRAFGTKPDKLDISYKQICDNCPETNAKISLGTIEGQPNEILTKSSLPNLKPGTYQIFVQGFDAKKNASGQVFTFTINVVEQEDDVFSLQPNPMSLYTNFNLKSAKAGRYELSIFDMMGRLVFAKNNTLQAGNNNIYWSATSQNNSKISNGTYVYQLAILRDNKRRVLQGKILYRP